MTKTPVRGAARSQQQPRWSEAKANLHLAEFKASGKTMAQFARDLRVPAGRILYWRQLLRPEQVRKRTPPAKFIALDGLHAPHAFANERASAIELSVGGLQLRIPLNIDPALLLTLINALQPSSK